MTGNNFLSKKILFPNEVTLSLSDFLYAAAKDETGAALEIILSWGYALTEKGMKDVKNERITKTEALLKTQFFITVLDEMASNHEAYGFNAALAQMAHDALDGHWEKIQELYLANRGQQTDELFMSLRPIATEWLQSMTALKERPALVNKEY